SRVLQRDVQNLDIAVIHHLLARVRIRPRRAWARGGVGLAASGAVTVAVVVVGGFFPGFAFVAVVVLFVGVVLVLVVVGGAGIGIERIRGGAAAGGQRDESEGQERRDLHSMGHG